MGAFDADMPDEVLWELSLDLDAPEYGDYSEQEGIFPPDRTARLT